jgi:hypothetical protein
MGSESRQRHCQVGSAVECDGFEVPPCVRTIDNASRHASELSDIAGDKLLGQVSTVAVLRESESRRHLHFFKELLALRLRNTNDQPCKARQ